MHVLINTECGHMLGCSNDKSQLQFWKNRLVIHGFKHWVIQERDFTDEEAMGMLDGERCGSCTVDGNLRQVLR